MISKKNSSSEITISTIVPCFNSSETIEACLDSVLNQESAVNELIVVDDGSSDDTVAIVNRIIANNATNIMIRLIRQENSGPSVARNKGVAEASGVYIAFLDSDDKWFPKHISEIRKVISLGTQYKIICTKYLSATFKRSGEINFEQTLFRNYFITPCVVMEREVFWKNGGFEKTMKYCEDYLLFIKTNYKNRGYIIDYIGAKNIEDKQPYGDKGLSGNLKKMHQGMLKCYDFLLIEKKIDLIQFYEAKVFATLKYYRRLLYGYFKNTN